MKYNGVDPSTLHKALSRSAEIVPGYPALNIETIDTAGGGLLAHVSVAQDTYTLRMNIAAQTYEEAMEARLALAEWAGSSHKQLAELEPTHMPGKAYSAIVKSISRIEKRFGTVDVTFLIPRPILHSTNESGASSNAKSVNIRIGGSSSAQLIISTMLTAETDELTISADGYPLFVLGGGFAAGQTVEVDMRTGAVLVDGEHAEERMVYTDMDPDVELMPGMHVIAASAESSITVRWSDEWL